MLGFVRGINEGREFRWLSEVETKYGYGKNGIEPHLTLSQYKKWKDQRGNLKVIFGENMLPLGEGRISVGDTITVTSYRNSPLVYGTNA